MGYVTYFYGRIKMNKSKLQIMKYLIDNCDDWKGWEFEVDDEDNEFIIQIGCKNYENKIEGVCLFIALLDETAVGDVEADGEEKEDIWKILVDKGEVKICQGYISYEKPTDFEDEAIKNDVKKILEDNNLRSKIILMEL